MARRKTVAEAKQVGPTFAQETPAAMAEAESQLGLNQAAMEDAMRLGHAIGRIQTEEFHETISLTIKLSAFEDAKKSKAYRFLVNPETETYFRSLEEFCEARLGATYRRMAQISANRNVLGQELFEQSERLGLRNIDYKALRALPADEQTLVKRAVEEAKSREEVIDLLQELAGRHQREREDRAEKIADLEADGEAKDRLIEDKNKKLDELARKGRRKGADPWPEEVAGLKDDLHGLGKIVDEALGRHLTLVDATEIEIGKHAEEDGSPALAGYKTVVHHLCEQIERICTLAAGLRSEFDTRLAGYIALDKTHVIPD